MTRPPTSRGTPSSERMPFSRRIGLRMSAWSTSSIVIARRSEAMRPAKPLPTGITTPLLDLFLDPSGGACVQQLAAVVEQQDRGGVGVQDLADPQQQLAQEFLVGEMRERRIRHPLERLELLRRLLRARARYSLLLEQAGVLDREGGAVGGELEQVALVGAEDARDEAADVQDADDAAFDQQGDAEQRADALLAQDRVEDVGVVDVFDRDRAALCGDAAGEALADGDHDAALDLFLDPLGGACVQQLAAVVEQQDRGGVGVQDLADPQQQLAQELLVGEMRERRIRHPLERLEHPPVRRQGWLGGLGHTPILR